MTYESIQLIGGPADGETRSWDGGDYIEVQQREDVKIGSSATASFRKLFTVKHVYRRRKSGSRLFDYLGVQ